MSLDWFKQLPLLTLPEEPTEITLTRDTMLAAADLNRFIESGGVVRNAGYRVFVDGDDGISHAALNALAPAHFPLPIEHDWRIGERVRVTRGEHTGRAGTVCLLSTSPFAEFLKISSGYVHVGLDGEPGQPDGTGGRGGVSVVIASNALEPYDGPTGLATSKRPR